MELSLAVNNSLVSLSKQYIFCTEPFRIPFAGRVDLACFDKTGTLTVEDLSVDGVVVLSGKQEIPPVIPAKASPPALIKILASTHSLAQLDSQTIGDPMERATLESIEYSLQKDTVFSATRETSLKIVKRYAFSSQLKRSACVSLVCDKGSYAKTLFVGVKGAPETIQEMLVTVPLNYTSTHQYYARNGARVLALAYKDLDIKVGAVATLARSDVESKLTFAGFLVFSCPLKPDSTAVVKELLQSSHAVFYYLYRLS